MRKDERELELVADSLGVTTAGTELRERAGSLGGSESGSDGGTSNHYERTKRNWGGEKGEVEEEVGW